MDELQKRYAQEARHKRSCIVLLHVHEMSRIGKFRHRRQPGECQEREDMGSSCQWVSSWGDEEGSFIICPSAQPQWGPGLFEPVFSPQDLCTCCSLPVKLSPQISRLVLPPSASSAGPLPGPHHPVFLHLTPPSNCSFYEDRDLVLLVASGYFLWHLKTVPGT